MRLKISRNAAQERLTALLVAGYEARELVRRDHRDKVAMGNYSAEADVPRYRESMRHWIDAVQGSLVETFPTRLELHEFSVQKSGPAFEYPDVGQAFGRLYYEAWLEYFDRLKAILEKHLDRYTDLPPEDRLYIEEVDSFSRVRDVNPAMVEKFLPGGYLQRSEDAIQEALERILAVPFHKKDWGGEQNDLYTANVVVGGRRRSTAFLLKGPGIGRHPMRISDCGKNGDQLVRLFASSADLFVIQYVGPIAEPVIADAAGKVAALRQAGKEAHFLVVDGQDTARVLFAYNELQR